MTGIEEFHREITGKNYKHLRPGIETTLYDAKCHRAFQFGSPALSMKRSFRPILAQLRRRDCFIMGTGPFGSLSLVPIAIP
jgi:hypothetical protein